MATEAPFDKVADVSESSDFSLADKSQDAVSGDATVNGKPTVGNDEIANKRITNLEEQINSAEVSVSGGSDTEASRPEWPRTKDGDKGHGRTTSSTKKPATFKAVSVNKTFLASKATSPSTTISKTSDKPSSGSSTPPPGSNILSASRPRLVAKTANAARDAAPRFSSAVNGGKPASAPDPNVVWNKNRPPEPKKLTDEELKKYGIHMASRLNEDDTQGQNKWADIDDDDDDWAPETITWGDGTKTTLPHLDDQTTAPSDTGESASTSYKPKAQEKPKSPVPAVVNASPLPRPIGLGSGKGLVLKGASMERPALVAKPPVPPGPAKSPWAQLPPVDRASPASAEPIRGPAREAPLYKVATAQPREIAADDFSRSSWRDMSSHGTKELYNSHSGRYEPVSDRRGGVRSDGQGKQQLALLQRGQPPDKAAEPSAAFQTNHVSQDSCMERRRGSSNVSGGSGSYLVRMAKGHDGTSLQPAPTEIVGSRPSSLVVSADVPQAPSSSSIHAAPSMAESRTPAKHAVVEAQTAAASDFSATEAKPALAADPLIDQVEFQKKVMQEKRELARKRREEEEAREKAARMERIQKKLDAMGPPPSKKSEKKESSVAEEGAKPTHIKQREPCEPGRDMAAKAIGAEANDYSMANTTKLRPNAAAEAKSAVAKDGSYVGPAGRRPSQGHDTKRLDSWTGGANRAEKLTPWTAGVSSQSRNVWGSPDNDRGLGNGTFNPDLGRISGSTVASSQGRKGPSPIAPPTAARASAQGQARPQSPIGPQSSRFAASGPDLASKWAVDISEKDKKMAAEKLAERKERDRQMMEKGLAVEDAQPIIKDTWRQVHLVGDGTRRVIASAQIQPVASWKTAQEKLTKDSAPVEASMPLTNAGVIGSGPSNSVLAPSNKGVASQPRASRFFPARDVRFEPTGPAAGPSRPASPCPPPPTMEGHPAYEGDVIHPHVSLPKPQPVVKLPPVKWTADPSHAQSRLDGTESSRFPNRETIHVGPRLEPSTSHPVKEERHRASWQDRIKNLLNGNKPLPMKHMDVNPASRSSLDHGMQQNMATVLLPGIMAADVPGSQKSPVSKPMAEDCFEEQEMGSLPQIRLPHKAPEAAWQPAPTHTKPLPKKFVVQSAIMEPYYFAADVVGGGNAIKIQFPGMAEARLVTIPFSATRGGRSAQSRSSPRHRGSGHGPRGARRETSNGNGYGNRDNGSSTSSRGGRTAYRRGSSESWARQLSAQVSGPVKAQQAPQLA
ncbi:hypothetical protein CDD81_5493 [Ophiocordyceps australis]|uniref:Uncharacterized protein n=1 Tax=Ophiocordyceps australis TaxID=1399860 RepID=A0A2C5XID1_9HYPO|nr:hypothetical protein CDD81_5493 [Ophiocordyceps australis]